MNRKTRALFVLIIFLIMIQGQVAAADDFPINFERYSERVLVIRGGHVYFDQIIAIASQKGLVVIDTGKAPTITKKYRKIIEHEFGRSDFLYVINTHYHFDHTDGNQVFADAQAIISHEKCPEMMRNFAKNRNEFIASRKPSLKKWTSQRDAAEPGSHDYLYYNDIVTSNEIMMNDLTDNYILTLPTFTFRDRLTLDLGDLTLKLIYFGEGLHTGDDILICCPEERLLFTGDLFYKGTIRTLYQPECDVERWIEVLNEVLAADDSVAYAYDTHNGRMPGSHIVLIRDYLVDLYEGVKAAKREGLFYAEVEKMFSFDLKFNYLERSGCDPQQLRKDHSESLRIMWLTLK